MTKSEKMMATKQAGKEARAAQTITVDENWKILRADPLNWEIRFKDKFQGYYGTIPNAFSALPAKMLGEEAKGSLNDLRRSLEGISEKIEKAIP